MRYYIIAGEASGDLHGSNLMRGLYAEDASARIRFWGGDAMVEAWKEQEGTPGLADGNKDSNNTKGGLVRHYRETAVMGYSAVLRKLGSIRRNMTLCRSDLLEWNADVLILIDYPGFNLKMAKFAHNHGIRVFYYIAPKVWASREGRLAKIRKYVDKLFIVFPFEIPYFQSKGIDFEYNGNPLVESVDRSVAACADRHDFLTGAGLGDFPYIALLAGSRKAEIESMMPRYMELVRRLGSKEKYHNLHFVIAGAPGRTLEDYEPWVKESGGNVHLVFGKTHGLLYHSEAAVINSGTASLEAVLTGTPQLVAWASSPLTVLIGRFIIRVKYISLGNLVLNRLAFKELVQKDFTADALENEVLRLMEDGEYRTAMLDSYREIREALGGNGASRSVAASMLRNLR